MFGLQTACFGFAVLLAAVAVACPNKCSGHGACGDNDSNGRDICSCEKHWNASWDCSLRNCPMGPAWVDHAIATDDAHNLAECSNMGLCDTATGQCKSSGSPNRMRADGVSSGHRNVCEWIQLGLLKSRQMYINARSCCDSR